MRVCAALIDVCGCVPRTLMRRVGWVGAAHTPCARAQEGRSAPSSGEAGWPTSLASRSLIPPKGGVGDCWRWAYRAYTAFFLDPRRFLTIAISLAASETLSTTCVRAHAQGLVPGGGGGTCRVERLARYACVCGRGGAPSAHTCTDLASDGGISSGVSLVKRPQSRGRWRVTFP